MPRALTKRCASPSICAALDDALGHALAIHGTSALHGYVHAGLPPWEIQLADLCMRVQELCLLLDCFKLLLAGWEREAVLLVWCSL